MWEMLAISSQKNIVLRSIILNLVVLHSITLKQAVMHLRHYRLLQSAVTPHLGHVLNARLMDDEDILARRNSCIGQANSFVCS